MLPIDKVPNDDESFVRFLNEQVLQLHIYLESVQDKTTLRDKLREIRKRAESPQHKQTYENAQSKIKPNIPFQRIVDEFFKYEDVLTYAIASENRPKNR